MENDDKELIDKQLIEDCLNDDDDAFAELTNRYLKPIYNFIHRLIGAAAEAEDLTQETFVKVWKHLKKYKKGESFKTWLFTIARNTTIDFLRKKKHISFSDFEKEDGGNMLEDTLKDTSPTPDEVFVKVENKELLEELLSKLSIQNREIILMHYVEDLTFDQIAKVLGKPLNTIKTRHRRALIEMKAKHKSLNQN